MTDLEAVAVLCDLAWKGKWEPLQEGNIHPLAFATVKALSDAGYEIVKRPIGPDKDDSWNV